MNCGAASAHLWNCLPLDRQELMEVVRVMHGLTGLTGAIIGRNGDAGAGLEIIITDDAGSEECNRDHLAVSGPTNILSFPLAERASTWSSEAGASGSLILSVDTLRRESLLYGQDPAEHAIRLLAHGLAHLAGLEHGPKMWALCERMEEAGGKCLAAMRG